MIIDKISIVTVCYNCEDFVKYAVSSVLNQITDDTFTIEYIIVNDKSTDNTLRVINDTIRCMQNHISNNIEIMMYDLNDNMGCGFARKYGIDHATGNYFMFLDADDYYIHNDFVKRAYKEIVSTDADIVEYGIRFNSIDGDTNVAASKYTVYENDNVLQTIVLFKDNVIKFNVWTKIYTRQIVESYPYSIERTYEDIRTIPVWVYNANKIVIVPSIEINYRFNYNSIIRNNVYEAKIGTLTALCDICKYFENNIDIIKSIYMRAMIDLEYILDNHTSADPYFEEASVLNDKMLSYFQKF